MSILDIHFYFWQNDFIIMSFQITQETYNRLVAELEEREKVRRKEIADRIKEAKELGDLSENAAYKEAQEEAALNEARIQKIREKLASAEIIPENHQKGGKVQVGSQVVIRKKGQKTLRNFSIVDSDEADPSQGKISFDSPLGRALLGKKKKDEAVLDLAQGKVKYIIEKIF